MSWRAGKGRQWGGDGWGSPAQFSRQQDSDCGPQRPRSGLQEDTIHLLALHNARRLPCPALPRRAAPGFAPSACGVCSDWGAVGLLLKLKPPPGGRFPPSRSQTLLPRVPAARCQLRCPGLTPSPPGLFLPLLWQSRGLRPGGQVSGALRFSRITADPSNFQGWTDARPTPDSPSLIQRVREPPASPGRASIHPLPRPSRLRSTASESASPVTLPSLRGPRAQPALLRAEPQLGGKLRAEKPPVAFLLPKLAALLSLPCPSDVHYFHSECSPDCARKSSSSVCCRECEV